MDNHEQIRQITKRLSQLIDQSGLECCLFLITKKPDGEYSSHLVIRLTDPDIAKVMSLFGTAITKLCLSAQKK